MPLPQPFFRAAGSNPGFSHDQPVATVHDAVCWTTEKAARRAALGCELFSPDRRGVRDTHGKDGS